LRRATIAAAIWVLGLSLIPGVADARHRHHRHRAHRAQRHARATPEKPGPGITLDPASGIYHISYYAPPAPGADPAGTPVKGKPAAKTLLHTTFVPATRIDPTIESDFVYRPDRREVQYAYRVANGRRAKAALVRIVIDPLSTVSALMLPPASAGGMDADHRTQFEGTASGALITPDHWSGTLSAHTGPGLRIVWQLDATPGAKGVAPGRAQAGFGLPADDLPGVVLAHLQGAAPAPPFGGNWPPGDIGDRLRYLAAHDYVTRPVAVPAIAVPEPYDPAALIGRIQAQMHTWVALQLLDPNFAERLDHHLIYAADGLRKGWIRDARYDLDAVHLLLAQQHPSLEGKEGPAHLLKRTAMQIDVVAARVLDFDLKYVEMRLDEAH
jgi:hypothetical protein